jgi:WD40 repeat protein/tRNA A-37 threonylcarbamoyl transferase component Bud32
MAQHSFDTETQEHRADQVSGARQQAEAPTLAPSSAPAIASAPATLRQIGDYELLQELGRGGMGVVYKARQISLNRIVAVKMILSGQLASAADVSRFRAEAEAAAHLDHPNILPIYEVGEYEGQQYFSMKLVEGGSLASFSRKPATSADSRRDIPRIVETLARAVHFAHQRGILHRDLKPGNILVAYRGESATSVPYITDFGLAKRIEAASGLTQSGAIVGTPSYMAPEQARANKVLTTAVDVYALGAILYELLTGGPPFRAATPLDTIMQVVELEAEPPSRLNPNVPRDLETICLKCLRKEPDRRYATAEALAADLRRVQEGRPIQARAVGKLERLVKWGRRRLLAAALVGVAALAAVLLLTLAAYFTARLADKNRLLAEQRDSEAAARRLAQTEKLRADDARQVAETQRDRAERLAYAGQLLLAHNAWNNNEPDYAMAYLNSCQWNLRGWEHDHLYTLFTGGKPRTVEGHTKPVTYVALSADGKRLASADESRVQVWDLEKNRLIVVLKDKAKHIGIDRDAANGAISVQASPDEMTSVAFSPDGNRLAAAGRSVRVWDLDTGKQLFKADEHGVLAFSSDGKRLSAHDILGRVKLLDAESGAVLASFERPPKDVARFDSSPDGRMQAGVSSENRLKVWDAETGAELWSFEAPGREVFQLAFSPDGERLAVASADQTIKIWDLKTGEQRLSLNGHKNSVVSATFSPDGQRLASASWDKTVKIWDAATGQEVLTLSGHTDHVLCVAFSADGKHLASGGADHTVRIWDAHRRQDAITLTGHEFWVNAVTFSPDGGRLASAGWYDPVKVWDMNTGQQLLALKDGPTGVQSLAFSPDGKRLALGTANPLNADEPGTLTLWDAVKGQRVRTLAGHSAGVSSVAFSPDGVRLASGGYDKMVRIWDTATDREPLTLQGHTEGVSGVAFSPDGQRLASAGWDNTARIWDTATGRQLMILKGHSEGVSSVAFSPDGNEVVTGSADKTVKLWEADSGRELLSLKGHTNFVTGVAISPDGKRLASCSADPANLWVPGEVIVWDIANGTAVLTFKGAFHCVTFSPDGSRLISGGLKEDAHSGQKIGDLKVYLLRELEKQQRDGPGNK